MVDAASYALWLTAFVFLALTPASLLVDAGFIGVKYGLFVIGFLSMGYALLLIRRATAIHREDYEPPDETRVDALVGRLPPLRWISVAPRDRFHPGTKLLVASVTMLAVSYVMEALFDIHV